MSLPLFFAIYCIEAGVFFAVLPWTRIWTFHPLLHRSAEVAVWADSPFVRGFISGVGVVHLLIGARDLVAIVRDHRARKAKE